MISSIRFLEEGGGVLDPASKHDTVLRALAEARIEIGSMIVSSPTRKAPQENASMIALREHFIMDTGIQVYRRLLAWYNNAKLWSSQRFDDHRGWERRRTSIIDGCLTTNLQRTKVSGVGKKRQELPVIVSSDCWLVHPEWLQVGFDLWKSCAPHRR